MKFKLLIFLISNSRRLQGGFFSESAMCLPNLKTKYSKSLCWTWNLNFSPITVNNIPIQIEVQGSDLEYFFWRFEKHISLSEKNYLYTGCRKSVKVKVFYEGHKNLPRLLSVNLKSTDRFLQIFVAFLENLNCIISI